jgi:aerobic-type carbon monoxide dehydrogenase small subunit (CoxS/CutS family)
MRANGSAVEVMVAAGTTLASVLRDQLGLISVKVACGRGECGACTVLIDGRPRMACVTLAGLVTAEGTTAEGSTAEVTTVEGLAEETAELRASLADHGAFQCGFCTPGQVVHAAAILRGPLPDQPERRRQWVRSRLSGNLCRCTGYTGIVDAVCAVAERRDGGGP